jgi:hypothetical protein
MFESEGDSVLATDSIVMLWLDEHDVPEEMIWKGERYRVSDRPTRLEVELPVLTHPPGVDAWRFQATGEAGDARVFDVVRVDGRQEWRLLRIYV